MPPLGQTVTDRPMATSQSPKAPDFFGPLGPEDQDNHSLTNQNTLFAFGYHVLVFSMVAIPLFALFAAHECTSIGYFLSPSLRCGSEHEFSPISPVWSRLFLVIYYYSLCKYCTFMES